MPDNGQVERMDRAIKDATVKRYNYDTHEQLRAHLQLFIDAYNHACRQRPCVASALRVHLPDLDERAQSLQARSITPQPRTIRLVHLPGVDC